MWCLRTESRSREEREVLEVLCFYKHLVPNGTADRRPGSTHLFCEIQLTCPPATSQHCGRRS